MYGAETQLYAETKGPGRALFRQVCLKNCPVKLTDELPVTRIVNSIGYDSKPT
jgi:hypothetical protein